MSGAEEKLKDAIRQAQRIANITGSPRWVKGFNGSIHISRGSLQDAIVVHPLPDDIRALYHVRAAGVTFAQADGKSLLDWINRTGPINVLATCYSDIVRRFNAKERDGAVRVGKAAPKQAAGGQYS